MNILLILSTLLLLYLITLFCEFFTNAIENLGTYYKIQEGALGSVFAAIGTALPETVLPLIAVLGAYITGTSIDIGKEIAKGAVLGSPFMLSTIAFFLVSFLVCVLAACKKRTSGISINTDFFRRDLQFFIVAYTIGIITFFIHWYFLKLLIAVFLLIYYLFYAIRTIKKHSCCDYCENECVELTFLKWFCINKKYKIYFIFFQLIISICGLVLSSHFFVENIKETAELLGISAMIISLFLAPVATELPEMINGMVWSSQKKDILAISNLTGAMVFQACIPMAIGIMFTNWSFSYDVAFNAAAVYFAFFVLFFSAKKTNNILSARYLLLTGIPYALYLFYSLG